MQPIGSILVVDSEATISALILEILTDEGYVAYSAPDGRGALAAIARHAPALMLLDLSIPDMSGAALIAQVRLADLATMPIVLMSTAPDTAAPLLVSQPIECLAKPFDLDDLLARVARYMQPAPAAYNPFPDISGIAPLWQRCQCAKGVGCPPSYVNCLAPTGKDAAVGLFTKSRRIAISMTSRSIDSGAYAANTQEHSDEPVRR